MSGCASDAPDARPSVSPPPRWGASVALREEVRVGVLEGDPAHELGRVAHLAVGARGEFVVADDAGPIVRVYDSAGTFVRTIGRRGDGPGEYRALGGLRTLADGRLLLWDPQRRRLTTYTDTGAVLAAVSVPSSFYSTDLLHVERDGTAWVRTLLPGDTGAASSPNALRPGGWIRVGPDGTVRDTVVVPTLADEARTFALIDPDGVARPFIRQRLSTVSVLGEVLTGDNAAYEIERRARDGTTRRIVHAGPPVPVGAGERAEWMAWATFFAAAQPGRARSTQVLGGASQAPAPVLPDVKPAFREVLADRDGRLWVRRYVAADSLPGPVRAAGDPRPRRVWREPAVYDVFDTDDAWLGTVTLPRDARFADASGDRVWVSGVGADGEPIVARYRIDPQPTTRLPRGDRPGDERPRPEGERERD